MQCRICPHNCGVDRAERPGVCGAPNVPRIALAALHYHEEPVISGARGSGTIFFSHCNLACVFCQNHNISHEHEGRNVAVARLSEIAFELRRRGAHNINLVSPTPYTEMILEALLPIRAELGLPIVWNTNAYELESTVRRLEPLVDVYLPDLKFIDSDVSKRYCGAADYFEFAGRAIGEMLRQKREVRMQNAECRIRTAKCKLQSANCKVQNAQSRMQDAEESAIRNPQSAMDEDDVELMTQGVIIRHLVIPGQAEDSKRVLRWIADNLGTEVYVSLMAQYTPVHRAREFPEVNRRLRVTEYDAVRDYFYDLGFENGWVQELSSASSEYTPDFDLKGT